MGHPVCTNRQSTLKLIEKDKFMEDTNMFKEYNIPAEMRQDYS